MKLKIYIYLLFNPATAFLGICLKVRKTGHVRYTYTKVDIAVLLFSNKKGFKGLNGNGKKQ